MIFMDFNSGDRKTRETKKYRFRSSPWKRTRDFAYGVFRRWPLAMRVWASFAVVLAIGAANAWVSIEGVMRIANDDEQILRSHHAVSEIQEAFVSVIGMETANRGYAITGRKEFLSALQKYEAGIPGKMAALKDALKETTGEGKDFPVLESLFQRKIRFVDDTARIRNSGGQAAALTFIAGGEGPRLTEGIGHLLEEMRSGQEGWLALHIQHSRREISLVRTLFLILDLAIFLFLCAMIYLMTGDLTRQEEISRLKSEFLANMSHELRTPMNAIIGFSELMYNNKVGPVSPEHKEYLGDILASSRHLLQLINDILDLSKIEAGKMEFRVENADLAALAAEVRDTLRGLAGQKGIRVEIQVEPTATRAAIDRSKFKQVLYNYLSNALKFTGEGGEIQMRIRSEGGSFFRLEVEDNGTGIKAEDIPRLFVEFQQLDSGFSKRNQGTGLGLALVRRLVEAQGGKVGVKSEPGKGSVFFAILPKEANYSTKPA